MTDTDTALILAAHMLKETAELPQSDNRDSELRDLCSEIQEVLGQPAQSNA